MTALGEGPTTTKPRPSDLVSAPTLKFAIGTVASLCAVLVPRLLAALTVQDQSNVTFITREYGEVAMLFSGLVGLVVAILEWRIPRAPRDTFMTTLGIPAILAGALSANQNTGALQQATQTQNALADTLSKESGIPIESQKTTGTDGLGRQGALTDFLVPPVYAASAQKATGPAGAQSQFAIIINQPRYVIVVDRAGTQQDAQAKAAQLTLRLTAAAGPPLSLQVQKHGLEFLVVVAGVARVKADAMIEAVRVKNTYHLSPTIVEVPGTN
jgi:hypothetical protein